MVLRTPIWWSWVKLSFVRKSHGRCASSSLPGDCGPGDGRCGAGGRSDLAQIGELIRMDPSFSAELLRFANSPLFGLPGEVRSVARATMLLGLERVKTMATMVALNR